MQTKNNSITELISLFIILILSFLLWDTYFIYPIKLFTILLHEISHVLSTIISGGTVINFNIAADLGGKCETEGGNIIFIALSGYLGSLLFGLLIFYSTQNKKVGRWILMVISLIILIPSIWLISNSLIVIFAIIISLAIFASSFFMDYKIILFLIKVFGMLSCVYVLFDIKEDVLSKSNAVSDASILSGLINIPTFIIGLVWILISLAGIIFLMKMSYFRKSK